MWTFCKIDLELSTNFFLKLVSLIKLSKLSFKFKKSKSYDKYVSPALIAVCKRIQDRFQCHRA